MDAKSVVNRILQLFANAIFAVVFVAVLYFICKIFVFDIYPVNTYSMSPTIGAGDRIMVNKFIFGARVYSGFDFIESGKMESFRVKGIRKVGYNDMVVFNHKVGYDIAFMINSVYVKRCIGLPGDTLSIKGGVYHNYPFRDTLGLSRPQQQLNGMELAPNVLHAMNFAYRFGWTIKNFGPLYIPRKGDVIELNRDNIWLYNRYIRYEQGGRFTMLNDSTVTIDGRPVSHYRFTTNYYFMSGDNVSDSYDSRYFGLVPEEFIIGVAPVVLYSRDSRGKIRWDRAFKRL